MWCPFEFGSDTFSGEYVGQDFYRHAATELCITRATLIASYLLVMLVSSECNHPATGPSPMPPAPIRVIDQISVSVMDTAWRPLTDALVEITSGSTVLSARTDSRGGAKFSGSFSGEISVRATNDGFATATQTLDVQSTAFVSFLMESLTPSVSLEPGDYTLTFMADPVCTGLPADIRVRAYAATIARKNASAVPPDTQYRVTVPGTLDWLDYPGGFNIGVSGNYVAAIDDTGDVIMDRLVSPFRLLEFGVGGGTSIASPNSPISFTASLEYCEATSAFSGFCRTSQVITDQKCGGTFTLTRR